MKLFLLAFGLLFSQTSSAELFTIAGVPKEFSLKGKLLVSGCTSQCEALKTIKQYSSIDLKAVRAGMKFTNSIGSDVCSLVYKADSLIGQAQNRDRRAFCLFKDKSIVEMNSLTEHLVEKKIVKE